MHSWEGSHREDVPSSVHHIRSYMIFRCITGDVNLDHVADLDYKVTIFLFVVTKYFGEIL